MSYDLQLLASAKEPLLLAELGAWLHNLGKMSEEFLYHKARVKGYAGYNYRMIVGIILTDWWKAKEATLNGQAEDLRNRCRAGLELPGLLQHLQQVQKNLRNRCRAAREDRTKALLTPKEREWLQQRILKLPRPMCDRVYALGDFVEFQQFWWYDTEGSDYGRPIDLVFPEGSRAVELLEAAHHVACAVDKDLPRSHRGGEQEEFPLFMSQAFGSESKICTAALAAARQGLLADLIKPDPTMTCAGRQALALALGDTRRPINEVTLLDLSAAVAAFFKAATAKQVLEGEWTDHPHDSLRWRILHVAADALAFCSPVSRIPDLKARQALLSGVLDEVRDRLEQTYCIGNEVYRDEMGSAFLVPDLHGDDERGELLRGLLQPQISALINIGPLSGEMQFDVTVSAAHEKGLMLHCALERPATQPCADPERVAEWWKSEVAEVCPICRLRPQEKPRRGVDQRQACRVCESRREKRARSWAENLDTTIWTDEVADANGRLALIVGQFDLRRWLDGTMVQTLLVNDPASQKAYPKNPSFARLRRVWETTRGFWQSLLDDPGLQGDPLLEMAGPRLIIEIDDATGLDLRSYCAYELVLGPAKLSVLHRNGDLITTANLHYLSRLLDATWRADGALPINVVRQWLEKRGPFDIEEPTGYGSPNKLRGQLGISAVRPETTLYAPAIPILAEPRTFMALVPADQALRSVEAIRLRYELEMSKVRNRLPLTLGAVYFARHTPLAAALDAGRRMLRPRAMEETWHVEAVCHHSSDQAPDQLRSSAHFRKWTEVKLRSGSRVVAVSVSTVMGDGTTDDVWYPYWQVHRDAGGAAPASRTRQFAGPKNGHWVHVDDLRQGDEVAYSPSVFDYEYLDTTVRRFEISYAEGQRRDAGRCQRPYLLEELGDIARVWSLLSQPQQVSTSQIKALAALIEMKRAQWGEPSGFQALSLPDEAPFRKLCRDSLATTSWPGRSWAALSPDQKELMERAALTGMLGDVVELYLTLAKERDAREEA